MSGVGARADVQQVVAISGNGGAGGLVVQSAVCSAFLSLRRERVALRLAFLKVGTRAVSAVSYLCRSGRLRRLRRVRVAAGDGGEEHVPAPAEPLVGCGSVQKTHKRSQQRSLSVLAFSVARANVQSRPADDLIDGPGLTRAENQWQEGSRRKIPAPGRLRRTGQRGRALLQGSARPRSAGGNRVGA